MSGELSKEKNNYVELSVHRAILDLPEQSVEVEITAKVYDGGELISVSRVYDMNEIRTMFQKADDGYIDEDDRFVLTDKGKAYLDEIGREEV